MLRLSHSTSLEAHHNSLLISVLTITQSALLLQRQSLKYYLSSIVIVMFSLLFTSPDGARAQTQSPSSQTQRVPNPTPSTTIRFMVQLPSNDTIVPARPIITEASYQINHIFVAYPRTGFTLRFGDRPVLSASPFPFPTAQTNPAVPPTSQRDSLDFDLGYDTFITLLTNKRQQIFSSTALATSINGPPNQIVTNRINKIAGNSAPINIPITLRDTCTAEEKYLTLMQDLLPFAGDGSPSNLPTNTYSLVLSYENFWFCDVSQIKYKGTESNVNRANVLNKIRAGATTQLPKSYWAMLNGDCFSHEPLRVNNRSDCNEFYRNIKNGSSNDRINPTALPWLQFQNIAATGESLLALLLYFKWSQVVIINDFRTVYDRQMALYVEDFLLKNEIAVNSRNEFTTIRSAVKRPENTNNSSTNTNKTAKRAINEPGGNDNNFIEQSLEETLQNLPSFIRCAIIIGDIFHRSIQNDAIEVLSRFVDNRKIVDNQGTPNKIAILVLETEYTFRIHSFNLDYNPGVVTTEGIAISPPIPPPTTQTSGNGSLSGSASPAKNSFTMKHIHFFNSLFILTYIPFFGITQPQYHAWYMDHIDKELLYLEQSKKDSAVKVTRIPSFLFSAYDYINYQSLTPAQKMVVMNRVITGDTSTQSVIGNQTKPVMTSSKSSIQQDSRRIFEIKSDLIGYSRISSEGLIMSPFLLLHFVDKLSTFKTVLYIEQDVENRSLINAPKAAAFKVIQNNFSQFIEPLFYYKNLGKLICEEKYVKDLDGPAEELSVAFFSVLLCGILGFSIFFFIKKRMSFKQMFLGPHKIIILPSDLDFNNLSVTNFKSKIMDEGSKADNLGHTSDELNREANASGQLLKAGSSGPAHGTSNNPASFVTSNPALDKTTSAGVPTVSGQQQQLQQNASLSSKLDGSVPVLGPHQGFQLARYMGDVVIIRPTPIRGSHIKSKTMRVLRMIRDLRHENINNLVGIYLKPEPPHSLVWEYCSRGSVEDIIKAENIKLDWHFKVSLLTDLAKGMRYIHSSPIRCHGNLKSRNCVIDSRWVLKVTGYGMTYLSEVEDFRIEKSIEDLLWVAPELLRDPILMAKGTQSGDIYSFAIIVQELIVRGPPYHNSTMTTEEILRKIQKPPPLIRPTVSKQDAPPQAIQLMKQCWAEPPNMRPDFNQILEQLKTTTQGRKTNIVDTMFKLLEKYSSNLEEIVQERTMQLEEERKKTEALLEKMLPKSVAESLKLGKPVPPESYNEVTIYFSDIVGFTTISAESTPFEVVDFLNDLYTTFDSIIQIYDAYKVETIGDAYMVVSGLPERNGERHAIEIATLALDLLHNAGKFKIRHKPDVRLKLRIGLHTGPCAAGVVGLTMPRYCLFGDTVNTASRMESNGKPLRIHISWTLRDKLEALGGFFVEYRGEIQVKGKGMMKTYWLNGKEGFDKSLPKISDEEENKPS